MSTNKLQKMNIFIKMFIHLSFLIYALNVLQQVIGHLHIPPLPESYWSWEWNVQLIPFYFVGDLISQYHYSQYHSGNSWFFWNAVKLSFYNMLLLLPLGVYLSIYKVNSLKRATAIIFLVSFLLEIVQLVLSYSGVIFARTFNVDDLILNTVGGVLGYFVLEQIKLFYRSFHFNAQNVDG
ncbi:VanZ family protein [Alkalihalophilus lindianensis]|uniref:VanZ family protein n=1 Tax=Alkalihalophilus lindianensis TaxID=1630542 RepID=A0ABU3X4D2_9BACI|nr:VanZ family protein [Alkalihalophilus lindianensis]MDV2682756.1 VanZ family protein [Alkalihalophilus lindianensis]